VLHCAQDSTSVNAVDATAAVVDCYSEFVKML
jgi:hypothetical protein